MTAPLMNEDIRIARELIAASHWKGTEMAHASRLLEVLLGEVERLRTGIQLALDQIALSAQRNGLTPMRLAPVVAGLEALMEKP